MKNLTVVSFIQNTIKWERWIFHENHNYIYENLNSRFIWSHYSLNWSHFSKSIKNKILIWSHYSLNWRHFSKIVK